MLENVKLQEFIERCLRLESKVERFCGLESWQRANLVREFLVGDRLKSFQAEPVYAVSGVGRMNPLKLAERRRVTSIYDWFTTPEGRQEAMEFSERVIESLGFRGAKDPQELRPPQITQPLSVITWEEVVDENQILSERGQYQHGTTSDGYAPSKAYFEARQSQQGDLAEALDDLRKLHKQAAFLFLNGNTYAKIGVDLAAILVEDLTMLQTEAITGHISGVDILPVGELREKLLGS